MSDLVHYQSALHIYDIYIYMYIYAEVHVYQVTSLHPRHMLVNHNHMYAKGCLPYD